MDSDESTIIMGAEVCPDDCGDPGDPDEEQLVKTGLIPPDMIPVASLVERAKFYTSLCLGTTAIVSVFAFLFLIPFVVDPAISSILANYEPEPITCVTVEHVYTEGLTNCSWASCREGCTTAALRCHQLRVNYSRTPYHQWAINEDPSTLHWDVADTRFFVNTEGCGYPPRVNCSEFAKQYGYLQARTGKPLPFPCYYSRAYPQMVVARYSWDDTLRHLLLSLIVPNVLFGVSIGVLCYWYCPGCQRPRPRPCAPDATYVDKFKHEEDDNEDEYDEEEEY